MEIDQKERIIELATAMFITEGIKAVRMDDVAQRACISKRTLYEMFSDKEELIYQSLLSYFLDFEQNNATITDGAPNIIIEMLEATKLVIQYSDTNWRLLNSLKRFYPNTHKRLLTERSMRRHAEFKRKLEIGVSQGILDHRVNLDIAMTMIHYAALSMAVSDNGYQFPDGVSPQDALIEMTIYFLRGISSPKGVDIIDQYIKEQETK